MLDPPQWPNRPPLDKVLAQLLAYAGLQGTIATLAGYTTHVDIFGNFHWDSWDMSLALAVMAPVYIMNIAIMLPSYHEWKLPDMKSMQAVHDGKQSSIENGDRAEDDHLLAQQDMTRPENAGISGNNTVAAVEVSSSSSSPVTSAMAPATSNGSISDVADGRGGELSTSSGTSLDLPVEPGTTDGAAQPWYVYAASAVTQNNIVCQLRDAVHLAQGHYIARNPTAAVPPALEGLVILVDCLAGEMLYRAVLLQLLGAWLADRLFEAGADDVITLWGGMGAVSTPVAAQLAAVLVGYVFTTALVGQRMFRSAHSSMWQIPAAGGEAAEQQQDRLQQSRASPSSSASNMASALGRASPRLQNAVVWSHLVQGIRDVTQTTMLGLSFVLTGNLAAPYVASVVNQALFSYLQRRGLERTRQVRQYFASIGSCMQFFALLADSFCPYLWR